MFKSITRRVLQPRAFGLDISDRTLKFVRLAPRRRGFAIDAFGEIEIPEGVIVDGEIKREADVASILKGGLTGAAGRKIRERYCVASLPEEKSFVRVLELPNVSGEDLGRAVRWEVEGTVPLPFADLYYDYAVVPSRVSHASDHLDVLLTAFPKDTIQAYHRAIAAAGFTALALELESQAITRAVVGEGMTGQSLLIIDMGAVRTSFIIYARGAIMFTKSITVGGLDIESAIAKGLGVSLAEAREVKVAHGLDLSYRDGVVAKILEPLLKRLIVELELELAFYQDQTRRRHGELGGVSAIYLCGGDANLIGLERYISTAVRRPVKVADPLVRLAYPSGAVPPIPRNESLKYTTAVGLALRAAAHTGE